MSGSASVTTLDQLCALAAADWDAPRRLQSWAEALDPCIKYVNFFIDYDYGSSLQPNPIGLMTDASHSATLNYSPSRSSAVRASNNSGVDDRRGHFGSDDAIGRQLPIS
jgi:hypothetical protein